MFIRFRSFVYKKQIQDNVSDLTEIEEKVSGITDVGFGDVAKPTCGSEQGAGKATVSDRVDTPFEDSHANASRGTYDTEKSQSDDIAKEISICKPDGSYIVGISLRGKSHIKDNLPCQDTHWFETIDEGWDLYVVSDGAGSAKYAERGSTANCKLIAKLMRQLLENNTWIKENKLPSELEWYIEIRSIFETMRLFYKSKVEEMSDGTVVNDFNATALVVLVTPKGLLSAHIGDGRMGYRDYNNNWHSIMTPHKGEEANQTLFVASCWERPMTPSYKINGLSIPEVRVIEEKPQVVILMSDGCEKASWECVMYDDVLGKYADKNTPYAFFLDPLLQALDDSKSNRQLTLQEIISNGTDICRREQDDKTMLIGRYL